jgi:hypothetical protein
MPRRLLICRACQQGDCADCANWLSRRDGCEHACEAEPRQLTLPWDSGEVTRPAGLSPRSAGGRGAGTTDPEA